MQEYELIYRFFERTLIHERRYIYAGQDERSFAFSYFDAATHHYFQDRLENIKHFGLPQANEGSFRFQDIRGQQIGIYMDELSLCPECGNFFFRSEAPHIFDLIRTRSKPFERVMKALIASRAKQPEFTTSPCGDVAECAQRRLRQERQMERYQRLHEVEARQPLRPKWVYLLRARESYKIGIAADVSARIKALQGACPYPISLVKSWQATEPLRCERLLHYRFRKHRVIGEWFDLPAAEAQWLAALDELFDAVGVEPSP